MTSGAGRCSGDSVDSSDVRTHAQSRAQLESPRARGPYTARCEFSPATVLRVTALQSNSTRCLVAYGAAQLTARHHVLVHKPMQVVTERHFTCPLGGWLQLHDAYWDCVGLGGKRGPSALGETPFLTAVALNRQGPPVMMHMSPVRLTREQ